MFVQAFCGAYRFNSFADARRDPRVARRIADEHFERWRDSTADFRFSLAFGRGPCHQITFDQREECPQDSVGRVFSQMVNAGDNWNIAS